MPYQDSYTSKRCDYSTAAQSSKMGMDIQSKTTQSQKLNNGPQPHPPEPQRTEAQRRYTCMISRRRYSTSGARASAASGDRLLIPMLCAITSIDSFGTMLILLSPSLRQLCAVLRPSFHIIRGRGSKAKSGERSLDRSSHERSSLDRQTHGAPRLCDDNPNERSSQQERAPAPEFRAYSQDTGKRAQFIARISVQVRRNYLFAPRGRSNFYLEKFSGPSFVNWDFSYPKGKKNRDYKRN